MATPQPLREGAILAESRKTGVPRARHSPGRRPVDHKATACRVHRTRIRVAPMTRISAATFSAAAAASIASNQSAIITASLGSSSQAAAISLIAGSGGGGGSYSFWAAPANVTLSTPIGGGTVTQTVVLNVQSSSLLDSMLTFSSSVATNQVQNWLSVSPSSGTLTLAPGSTSSPFTYIATVTITANSTGIPAGSEYEGVVNYLAGGEMAMTAVTMDVTAQTIPPSLSVSPLTANFALILGASPSPGQLTVSNTGGGTLQFSVQATSSPGNWLTLTGGGSGSATPSSPASLSFTVDPTGLSPGLYTGQITVQYANSPRSTALNAILAVSCAARTQVWPLSQSGLTFFGDEVATKRRTSSLSPCRFAGT